MKIASPRARTQSGSVVWADTLRLDSTAIQAAPASKLATSAVGVSCARPNRTSASAVPTVPAATSPVGAEPPLGVGQREGAGDRARPNGAEQHAVGLRPGRDLVAGDERQQRPIGAGEQEEGERAHERRAQMHVVARMAQPSADRAGEALGRQMARAAPRRMPPQQRAVDAEIGRRVDPERRRNAEGRREGAAERRPDGAADVEADAVHRDRDVQILLGHEQRRYRLPGRRREGRERAGEEREIEEGRRRH